MNRQDFLALFNSTSEAMEFESNCLLIGTGFLPEVARRVVSEGEEPGSDYWKWLIQQFEMQY